MSEVKRRYFGPRAPRKRNPEGPRRVVGQRACKLCGAIFEVTSKKPNKLTCGEICTEKLQAEGRRKANEGRAQRTRARFEQIVDEVIGRSNRLTRDQLIEMVAHADRMGYQRAKSPEYQKNKARARKSADTSREPMEASAHA